MARSIRGLATRLRSIRGSAISVCRRLAARCPSSRRASGHRSIGCILSSRCRQGLRCGPARSGRRRGTPAQGFRCRRGIPTRVFLRRRVILTPACRQIRGTLMPACRLAGIPATGCRRRPIGWSPGYRESGGGTWPSTRHWPWAIRSRQRLRQRLSFGATPADRSSVWPRATECRGVPLPPRPSLPDITGLWSLLGSVQR
jgi:hypothetical protein